MTNVDGKATAARATGRIPTASGDDLDAWLYLPAGDGPHPAVVMADGREAHRQTQQTGLVPEGPG